MHNFFFKDFPIEKIGKTKENEQIGIMQMLKDNIYIPVILNSDGMNGTVDGYVVPNGLRCFSSYEETKSWIERELL